MTAFILKVDNARSRMKAAWDFACSFLEAGESARVTVEPVKPTRSIEQNDKMWAVLTDISRQVKWPVDGTIQHLSPEEWKHVLTAGLTRHQRIAQGIDGGFVILGTRTSKMTIGQMSELIELAHEFGSRHDVKWGAP